MKGKLKKLSESTIAKVLIATVVPGGFIAWGFYEIGKVIGERKLSKHDDDTSKTEDS